MERHSKLDQYTWWSRNDIINKSAGICGEEHFVFHEWKYSMEVLWWQLFCLDIGSAVYRSVVRLYGCIYIRINPCIQEEGHHSGTITVSKGSLICGHETGTAKCSRAYRTSCPSLLTRRKLVLSQGFNECQSRTENHLHEFTLCSSLWKYY